MVNTAGSDLNSFDFASVFSLFPELEEIDAHSDAHPDGTAGETTEARALSDYNAGYLSHCDSIDLEIDNKISASAPCTTTARITRSSATILEQWMESHSNHPYPTQEDKALLRKDTGLNDKQLSTWFSNARRRRKRGNSRHDDKIEAWSQNLHASFPGPAAEGWSSMSPLDRWRNSPPEEEPAALTAILDIANHGSRPESRRSDALHQSHTSERGETEQCPQPVAHSAPSVVSKNSGDSRVSSTSGSSGSSAHSLSSNNSHGSFGRFYATESPRRQRRKKLRSRPGGCSRSTAERRRFQCTFCTDTFKSKHDWTRHEKTLHLSLESWVCAPFGAIYEDAFSAIEKCAFCDHSNPSESHIASHRYQQCQDKPWSLRTFYRKDHLRQHLRLVHGVGGLIPTMERWKSEVKQINSRCGFCGQDFILWSKRNDHIAQHFLAGALMKDWQGCRGLDPPVALAVENAMPPYLIGIESKGLEPFSASRRARRSVNVKSRMVTDANEEGCVSTARIQPTPFEHLTAQLRQFVQQARAAGTPLTDEMLQKQARCIVFGDEDPWNQTAADNPEWLKMFKEGMGLDSTSSVIQPEPSAPVGAALGARGSEFCIPWSSVEWTPYSTEECFAGFIPDSETGNGTAINTFPASGAVDIMDGYMPWSWQSPECLVEYRRKNLAEPCAVPVDNVPFSLRDQMSTNQTAMALTCERTDRQNEEDYVAIGATS